MSQAKAFYRQRYSGSSYARKENIAIDILATYRYSGWKIIQSIRITSRLPVQNKEVEPIEPVQMNIYQSDTCVKGLTWLHLDNEPRFQERQQVKDQHS